jgi:rubrerythrin
MPHDYLLLRDPRSRRDFFRLAGITTAGGSAAFLAACGDDDDEGASTAGRSQSGTEGDIAVLNSALDLEYTAVAAYTAGAPLLRGRVKALAEQFLEHEREHAEGLSQAVTDLGGTPNKAQSQAQYADGFPKLDSANDVLRFAVDLEETAVAAYIDAQAKLTTSELRGTASAIGTNEAEHISVLLGALGRPPVPDAFVTGKKSP